MESSKCHSIGMKCDVFPKNIADTEYFLQLQKLKSKS